MLQDVWLAIDERRYGQAESILQTSDELRPTRAGQMALGYILSHTGRHEEAREVYRNLREQHRGDEWEHIAVHQQGRVERLAGEHRKALEFFAEERKLIEKHSDDPHKFAANAFEAAQCHLALLNLKEARHRMTEALERAHQHDDPEMLGRAERGMADLSLLEGHPDAAKLHLERAQVAFQQADDEFAVREIDAQLQNL
ncbi:tetratricopeptide repeat protein [Deinococcus fonticola]|uniref:tetratricopeptide repeat protein n=1 Tax=Deinococcus fonticola TaxID=2528713 RepID=UPI001074D8F9|nr:hypothetical protein [Deinococcus fonticola]